MALGLSPQGGGGTDRARLGPRRAANGKISTTAGVWAGETATAVSPTFSDASTISSIEWFYDGSSEGTGTTLTIPTYVSGEDKLYVRFTVDAADSADGVEGVWEYEADWLTAPVNVAAPSIASSAFVGEVLTVSPGAWSGAFAASTYQWKRDGSNISGQTGTTYTTRAADDGKTVTCTETRTNLAGSASETTAGCAVTVGATAPTITTNPSISSSAVIGDTVTVTSGTVTGNPAPTSTYQWYLDAVAISGATGTTYTTTAAGALTVVQTATNSEGTDTATSSACTVTAAPTYPAMTAIEAINGYPMSVDVSGDFENVASPNSFTVVGGSLPAGITINSSGVISGTHSGNVTGSVDIEAENAGGDTEILSAAIRITDAPTVLVFYGQSQNNAHQPSNPAINNYPIFVWDGDNDTAEVAVNPLPNPEGSGSTGNSIPAEVGKLYKADHPDEVVLIMNTSDGGTGLDNEWESTGSAYTAAMSWVTSLQTALPNAVFHDSIWGAHGGAASSLSEAEMLAALLQFKADIIADVGLSASAKFVNGTIFRQDSDTDRLNAAIVSMPNSDPNTNSCDWRTGLTAIDTIHLNNASTIIGAQRQYDAYLAIGNDVAPTNQIAPAIASSGSTGDTLTVTAGTWHAIPAATLSYQWQRDGVDISGETGTTYTLVGADEGTTITVVETATNTEGSATATSNGCSASAAAPAGITLVNAARMPDVDFSGGTSQVFSAVDTTGAQSGDILYCAFAIRNTTDTAASAGADSGTLVDRTTENDGDIIALYKFPLTSSGDSRTVTLTTDTTGLRGSGYAFVVRGADTEETQEDHNWTSPGPTATVTTPASTLVFQMLHGTGGGSTVPTAYTLANTLTAGQINSVSHYVACSYEVFASAQTGLTVSTTANAWADSNCLTVEIYNA